MSTFLGFESYLIQMGSTAQNILDTFKTSLTGYGWQTMRVSVPTTVMASSTIANYANACDMLSTTVAGNTAALPVWVGLQTVSAFTPTKMHLQGHVDASTTAPMTFTLDWSDNGTSWTTQQTWNNEIVWQSYERRIYTISGASPHNYWRLNVTARQTGQSTLYINEWLLEDASHNIATPVYFMDIIPPVTETIGNSFAKESIRIQIAGNGNTISLRPQQELLQYVPQHYVFSTPTAGAVTLSVTINGSTVSFVGDATKTAFQNARGLYDACRSSSDSNFLSWNWIWNGELAGNLTIGYFVAIRNIDAPNMVITSSNITTYARSNHHSAPSMQGCGFAQWSQLSSDVTNGFIYYLQVTSRGLALATKTNAAFYGPVHACYANNADAIAQIPESQFPTQIPCTAIELFVGSDDAATSATATAKISHWWGSGTVYTNNIAQIDIESSGWNANVWTKHNSGIYIQDWMNGATGYLGSTYITLKGETIYSGTDTSSYWNVHRLGLDGTDNWQYCYGGYANGRSFAPMYPNYLDWYKYYGTLTDEQLVFCGSDDFTTNLTSPITATDTIINVTSTTGWPSSGYLVIDNESIQYTGVTDTSFTGCIRAKYASQAFPGYVGDKVLIGAWFVKINTGLLFAGYTKPV